MKPADRFQVETLGGMYQRLVCESGNMSPKSEVAVHCRGERRWGRDDPDLSSELDRNSNPGGRMKLGHDPIHQKVKSEGMCGIQEDQQVCVGTGDPPWVRASPSTCNLQFAVPSARGTFTFFQRR